jgi:hypothetical protein
VIQKIKRARSEKSFALFALVTVRHILFAAFTIESTAKTLFTAKTATPALAGSRHYSFFGLLIIYRTRQSSQLNMRRRTRTTPFL